MLVREAMTPHPITATLRMSVREALRQLGDHRISAMPVVDGDGRLRGIVSELDLLRSAVGGAPGEHDRPAASEVVVPPTVESVYTRATVTIAPDDEVAVAVELMTELGAKSLPVVDRGDQVVGMVSRSDVVRALARHDAAIATDIHQKLASVGYDEWLVQVDNGIVTIGGPTDIGQESLARVVARTVAGVVDVRVERA